MSQVTYYWNGYDEAVHFETNPQNACNDDTADYAQSVVSNSGHTDFMLNSNTCPGTDLGTIRKVEIRGYIAVDSNCTLEFIAGILGVIEAGLEYVTDVGPAWTSWMDVTSIDEYFTPPNAWTWTYVKNLFLKLQNKANGVPSGTAKAYALELRVTYGSETVEKTTSSDASVKAKTSPLPLFFRSV